MNAQARRRPQPKIGHRMTIINWLTSRSTGDLLVLIIASTVCFSVLASGATVVAVKFLHPEADVSQVVGTISDILNTLIGLLAGFLAGRTDAAQTALRDIEAAAHRNAESAQSIAESKARAMSDSQKP